jgi:hypothetical protein
MTYEDKLRHQIRNTLEGHFALAQVGERVLLVNAAWRALQEDPETAEKDFSKFILSIARSPECAWLDFSFMHIPGSDENGELVLIDHPAIRSPVPKKQG